MTQLFTNGASGRLAASIGTLDTECFLEAGQGALFPTPVAGDFFLITIEDDLGNYEICRCENRVDDTLQLNQRGLENTAAQSFLGGSRVEIRATAGTMANFIQGDDIDIQTDLNMNGNNIDNVGDIGVTNVIATVLKGVLTANDDSLNNSIVVPDADQPPLIGGSIILTVDNFDSEVDLSTILPPGIITLWSGLVSLIPAGWTLCDGTSGTPDLRDRFVVGADGLYAPGDTGGAVTDTTDAVEQSVAVDGHALTESELPAHDHFVANVDTPNGSAASPTQHTPQEDQQGGGDRQYVLGGTATVPTLNKTSPVGADAAHTHGVTTGTHTHEVDILPPYYALAYIMRL